MSVKKGLSFFRLDTDRYQDKRIKRLRKDFKRDGVAVYDYILCEIYRVEGSFIVWDESTAFDVADYWELKETVLSEIVNYCCAVGLFDKRLFTSERVLTSGSIQRRYSEICKLMKRTVIIPEKYLIPPEVGAKIPEVGAEIQEVFAQSREEKSREEKKKGEGETPAPDNFLKNGFEKKNAAAAPANFQAPELAEVSRFFFNTTKDYWDGGLSSTAAIKFYTHYRGLGWKTSLGAQVEDWQALANGWIIKDVEDLRNKKKSFQATNKKGQNIEQDINSLYEQFCNNPDENFFISMWPDHYVYLEKKGLIDFSPDKLKEIEDRARRYLTGKKIKTDQIILKSTSQKIGLLEFFKEQLRQGRETVFKI